MTPEIPRTPESPTAPRARFRPHERMRRPEDFRRAFEARRSTSDAVLVVHVAENGLDHARLGVAVPRKLTRSSVMRHRIKRLMREVFRSNKVRFATGVDFVVVPRSTELTLENVQASLPVLATDAARRLRRGRGGS